MTFIAKIETRPDSPCESGMQPRVPVAPGEENSVLDTSLDEVYFALQLLESNRQLSLANRMEDWTSLGQHKRKPEFPVVTRESRRSLRKTTWLPRHHKMRPLATTAYQEKSHVPSWSTKRYLAPLMRPPYPDFPVSVQESPVDAWADSALLWAQGHWMHQWVHMSFWRWSSLLSLRLP